MQTIKICLMFFWLLNYGSLVMFEVFLNFYRYFKCAWVYLSYDETTIMLCLNSKLNVFSFSFMLGALDDI